MSEEICIVCIGWCFESTDDLDEHMVYDILGWYDLQGHIEVYRDDIYFKIY